MSDTEQTQEQVQQTQDRPQFDPARLGCRVLDVHSALQQAFITFSQGTDTSLEGLAKVIQDCLGEIPAFLIGDEQTGPTQG